MSYANKQQKSMALSNIELEYMALSKVIAEAIWLRRLLHDPDPQLKLP